VAGDGRDETRSRYKDLALECTRLTRGTEKLPTYSTANLRGFTTKTPVGISAKHITNIAAAAILRPPNKSNRSHRLTIVTGCRQLDGSKFKTKAGNAVLETCVGQAAAARLMHGEDGNAGTGTL
jgi:hypothetical protein